MEYRLHDLLVAAEDEADDGESAGPPPAAWLGAGDPDEDRPAQLVPVRWARVVLGLTVAVLAMALTAGIVLLRPTGPPRGRHGTAPQLTTPGKHPAQLPNGPVGAANFGYVPCRAGCPFMLVLASGRQFSLPGGGYALSPDGRWLGRTSANGVEFRDLTTGTTVDFADDGPGTSDVRAWSPGGRWVLVVRTAEDGTGHVTAVGLAGGERYRVPAEELTPVAIRDDGLVLSWSGGERLISADVSSGGVVPRDEVVPDLRSLINGGELVRTGGLLLDPTGRQALLTVYQPAADGGAGQAVALLLVDLDDGHAISRFDPGVGGVGWTARGLVAGGVILAVTGADRTELVRLDEASGAHSVLAAVAAGATILTRGGAGVSGPE